jgi:large subunit ribosomal protein L7/L12
MAAPAAGGEAAAAVEEQTEFDVVMTSFGAEKVKVIKEVRGITGLGLAEAKGLVEGVPAKIKEGIGKDEATEIMEKLKAVGAAVELR